MLLLRTDSPVARKISFFSYLAREVLFYYFFQTSIFFFFFLQISILHKNGKNSTTGDLPGDAVVKNLPANAGAWVRALVREDPTCLGATKPMCHNY